MECASFILIQMKWNECVIKLNAAHPGILEVYQD